MPSTISRIELFPCKGPDDHRSVMKRSSHEYMGHSLLIYHHCALSSVDAKQSTHVIRHFGEDLYVAHARSIPRAVSRSSATGRWQNDAAATAKADAVNARALAESAQHDLVAIRQERAGLSARQRERRGAAPGQL